MRRSSAWRRRVLWAALIAVVVAMLLTLVWLAGRYEAGRMQERLEREAAEAVSDIKHALNRHAQTLYALQYKDPTPQEWSEAAVAQLRAHRDLVRLEWRDAQFGLRAQADSPFRSPVFGRDGQGRPRATMAQTCATALRISGPVYSESYFVPQPGGLGYEVMDMCLPTLEEGRYTGYLVASYALPEMLEELVQRKLGQDQELSLTQGDGTRLAIHGRAVRTRYLISTHALLDLGGVTLVLRLDTWRGAPALFPNVLTALVATMALLLLALLALLGKDMRRRLKAERELAQALAFRKAMEDSLVTGLRARDLQGRITYVNPAFCEMVGFSAEELLGQSVDAPYWPPELSEEYRRQQAIRLAGTVPPREGFESVYMHKDGRRFPVLIIEAPLINDQGVQTGWMSAFLDISEQRRIEELSRASQDRLQATARLAMVGEMASLLSHELNQPLAVIASYATGSLNLLGPDQGSTGDIALALKRIAEQAERAGKVIRSVHDVVRRRDQAREAVTPRALFDAIWPLLTLQARKLRVDMTLDIDAGQEQVVCDRTMVEQVLLNLARNAMQAMDRPEIRRRVLQLSARKQELGDAGRWIEFSVADNGPGIAPEIEAQLFTPFFTTKAEGMGLGLSLCRTVVEQHGGTLNYASQAGQGTVFSFTLPLAGLS